MNRRTMMIATACAAACAAAARALPQSSDSSQRLNALFDQFMRENLDLSPLQVTYLGMDTGARATQKSAIDDGSPAGIERQKALIASQLARLKAFDRASLSASDAISYDVILFGLRTTDASNNAFRYGVTGFWSVGAGQPYALSPRTGSYQQLPTFLDNQHVIETKADADAYVARLAGFATVLDQEIEAARRDAAMGVTPPDFALAKTLSQFLHLRQRFRQCEIRRRNTHSCITARGLDLLVEHSRKASEAGDIRIRIGFRFDDVLIVQERGQLLITAGARAERIGLSGANRPEARDSVAERIVGGICGTQPEQNDVVADRIRGTEARAVEGFQTRQLARDQRLLPLDSRRRSIVDGALLCRARPGIHSKIGHLQRRKIQILPHELIEQSVQPLRAVGALWQGAGSSGAGCGARGSNHHRTAVHGSQCRCERPHDRDRLLQRNGHSPHEILALARRIGASPCRLSNNPARHCRRSPPRPRLRRYGWLRMLGIRVIRAE